MIIELVSMVPTIRVDRHPWTSLVTELARSQPLQVVPIGDGAAGLTWDAGPVIDAADLTLSDAERRQLVTWASACAVRLLPTFDADSPGDSRLRDALAGAELFTAEQLGVGAVRKLALGCHAAAREARSPEATAVARVVGQAVSVAHMAGHSREIARYTRKALSGPALDVGLAWQREHVPPQFAAYVFVDGVR